MQNYSGDYKIQFYAEGLSEDFTAGADYTSGDPIAVAGRAGIVSADVVSGKKGAARVSGLAVGRKITGVMAAGAAIGWDNDGDPLNGTAGSGALTTVLGDMDIVMGSVAVAALETDETVVLRLNSFANADVLDAAPLQAHVVDVAAQTQDALTDNLSGAADTTLADVVPAAAITDSSTGTDPGDDTIAAITEAAAITDNGGGTDPGDDTIAAVSDPADTPADADALRDDLVANALPEIRNAVSQLAAKMNTNSTAIDSASDAVAQLAAKQNTTTTAVGVVEADLKDIAAQLTKIKADVAVDKTKINAILVALETAKIVASA